MRQKLSKYLSFFLILVLALSLLPMNGFAARTKKDIAISCSYGNDYQFEKVSNPTSGSQEPDGINTNDETAYSDNRLNSYAWAVAARGDYIYIGTNRTLFGSALNAVYDQLKNYNPDLKMTRKALNTVIGLISRGDVPVNLEDEEYIPQIIRFDVKNGSTKVIYQPKTVEVDGILYYTDKDGNIINNADVASETASFRSVIEYNGSLYFGSLGTNMLQLVRVDENDNAEVVYQTIGLISSLRAGCVHDPGDGDTLYYGGQDTTYLKWRKEYGKAQDRPLPIVIRYLDPSTAGTSQENWDGLIADYEDFGQYAKASVYVKGGGNVWDLCSYNGKLYLILAHEDGWVMFRGEKGGANPNSFGWTWTEIVGNHGNYPAAMNADVASLNKQYKEDYGCSEYSALMDGSGLLESTATPFVYKGKMYIGSFDNATTIQTDTTRKLVQKFINWTDGDSDFTGPSLKQIFAPIYEVMSHPQHVWVMDENERITPVKEANDLLKGTTNDYVWRFVEKDGKLYTSTFDSSTAYNYYLGIDFSSFINSLIDNNIDIPEKVKALLNGRTFDKMQKLLNRLETVKAASADELSAKEQSENKTRDSAEQEFFAAAQEASDTLQDFNDNKKTVEDIIPVIERLKASREALTEEEDVKTFAAKEELEALAAEEDAEDPAEEDPEEKRRLAALIDYVDQIADFYDIEGLTYWAKARKLVRKADKGFDLFVTADGNKWDKILADGLDDPYNYGGRTLTVFNNELYIGTANPYYGAQLWKLKNPDKSDIFNVKITTQGEGTAASDPASGVPGTKITLLATPKDGYQFKEWKVESGDVTIKNNQFILGNSNVEIKAIFEKTSKVEDSDIALRLKAGGIITVAKIRGKVKSWISSNTKIAKVKDGKITALKKGTVTITETLENGEKRSYKVVVTSSPKLSKKKITVKKGKTAIIKIKGKAPGVKNSYKKTEYAKITSKRTAKTLKIKGLKKGKTVLKIKVNGVTLKLKVTVK